MEQKTIEDKISDVASEWFLKEPLLFGVYCTHKLTRNAKIRVPVRCGKMRIEYNPDLLKGLDVPKIAELLKVEVLRIILKHPYQRQPACPVLAVLSLASDVTISDNYKSTVTLPKAADFELSKNLCFEEYYAKLLKNLKNELQALPQMSDEGDDEDDSSGGGGFSEGEEGGNSGGQSGANSADSKMVGTLLEHRDAAGLWEENQEAAETINSEIERAKMSNSWGSLGGNLQQLIEASLVIQMDYRRMLSGFRATILSSARKLTRMRPNRRYGFAYMGSRAEFTTGLLVAVDVSGSISDEALQQFFSIVNRFFKYGIQKIDVIQFDAEMKEEVLSLRKAKKQVKIVGRGGTDFQPAIDFYEKHREYDGLIMFTDGYAATPKLHRYAENILWVLTSRSEYENFAKTMLDHLPGSRATYIP